jgi:hypothetical protein
MFRDRGRGIVPRCHTDRVDDRPGDCRQIGHAQTSTSCFSLTFGLTALEPNVTRTKSLQDHRWFDKIPSRTLAGPLELCR